MQRKAYGSLTKIFMCPARKQTKPKHGGICLRPHGNRPLLPSRAICRFQSVSRGFCTRGGSGATVSPFRRNGITVPAQRHHRSGATVSPFRRNGIAVPAQRHRRSGATVQPCPGTGLPKPRKGTQREWSDCCRQDAEKSSARCLTTLAFCRSFVQIPVEL